MKLIIGGSKDSMEDGNGVRNDEENLASWDMERKGGLDGRL